MNPETNNQLPVDPLSQPQPQVFTPQPVAPSTIPNYPQPAPMVSPQASPAIAQPVIPTPDQTYSPAPLNQGGKDYLATLLFTWLLGFLGVDGFYLGCYGSGAIRLLLGITGLVAPWVVPASSSLFLFLISIGPPLIVSLWIVVNVLRTVSGKRTDKQGRPLVGRERHTTIGKIVRVVVVLQVTLSVGILVLLGISQHNLNNRLTNNGTSARGTAQFPGESAGTIEDTDLSNVLGDLSNVESDSIPDDSTNTVDVAALTKACTTMSNDYAIAQKQATKLNSAQKQVVATALGDAAPANQDCKNIEQNPNSEDVQNTISDDIGNYVNDISNIDPSSLDN